MKRQLRAREVDGIAETGVDRISHLIIIVVFVFASQVPFEPPLHRPVRWAGIERPAACKPIFVLGRAKRGALGMVERLQGEKSDPVALFPGASDELSSWKIICILWFGLYYISVAWE